MNPEFEKHLHLSRREFFGKSASGVGIAALAALLEQDGLASAPPQRSEMPPLPGLPHFKPTAKRVVFCGRAARRLTSIFSIINQDCWLDEESRFQRASDLRLDFPR